MACPMLVIIIIGLSWIVLSDAYIYCMKGIADTHFALLLCGFLLLEKAGHQLQLLPELMKF